MLSLTPRVRALVLTLGLLLLAAAASAQALPGRGRPRTGRGADERPYDSTQVRPGTTEPGTRAPALNRYVPASEPGLSPLTEIERAAIDSAMTSFGEKQADLVRLLERQLPRLQLLSQQLAPHESALRDADSLLAYPANLPLYRDSVMHTLVRIRRFLATGDRQLREMHFTWLPHTMDLMAVYTRFGELTVLRRDDAALRSFIRLYRQHHQLMDNLALRFNDLYQVSEYLLNSKLN